MNRIVLYVLVAIIICLAGCSAVDLQDTMDEIESIDEPTLTPKPTQPPAQTSAPTPTPEPTPTPLPTWQPVEAGSQAGDAYSISALDAHIPSVKYDSTSATRTGEEMQEDEDYIYFLWRYSTKVERLYCLNKNDGGVKKITDDCACFTVNEGFVYYTNFGTEKRGDERIDSIIAFDTATNTAEKILEFAGEITDFACHNSRLYFISQNEKIWVEEDRRESENSVDVLYSTGFDGGEIVREAEDVTAACFYGNRRFYVSTVSEGGFFYELFADGTSERKYEEAVEWQLGVSRNKVIFTKMEDACVMYDINTERTTKLPFENYDFALLGQYVLYIDGDRFYEDFVLSAYDTESGKGYELLSASWNDEEQRSPSVYCTNGHVYLAIASLEAITIYQVEIDNGDISVSHLVTINE